jgi:hypothetical protein
MARRYTECPECGTKIIGPYECAYCEGNKGFYDSKTGDYLGECKMCGGEGLSNNYYCPHCDWSM